VAVATEGRGLPGIEEQLPGVDEKARLTPLLRGVWRLAPYLILPNTPAGTRAIVEMPDGHLEGRAFSARVRGAANADWMVIGPNGVATADVRGTVETDDGALIYMHGHGRCDLSSGFGSGAILRGSALFDTSAEQYQWLNRIQAIFRGVVVGDGAAGEGVFHDEYFEVT
jgi:hypothetical protein